MKIADTTAGGRAKKRRRPRLRIWKRLEARASSASTPAPRHALPLT